MIRTAKMLLVLAFAFATPSYTAAAALTLTEVAPGIHLITGAGGNAALVVGDEAVFLIDDKVGAVSEEILALANGTAMEHTGRPVDFILNTHYHGDHTGTNSAFRAAGSWTFAHHNVRARMVAEEDQYEALPVFTFAEDLRLNINGMAIRAYHQPEAHTDGDSLVIFEGMNIVHMGDVMFNGMFPYIDLDGGGSVDGYVQAVEDVLTRIDADTVIIPGHGPLADRDDLVALRDMIVTVRDRVRSAVDRGLTLEEVMAESPSAEYDADWNWNFITTERFVSTLYTDATDGG